MKRFAVIFVLLTLMGLLGCGQKGPLYLPHKDASHQKVGTTKK